MLCSANLQDQAVFAMWSLKVTCSSKITPRFLTELDGVIVDEQHKLSVIPPLEAALAAYNDSRPSQRNLEIY